MRFTFEGVGLVQEKRELAKKGEPNNIWRRLVKLAYLGGMLEVVVDAAQFASLKVGETVKCVGNVAPGFDGNMMLVASQFAPAK